MGRRAHARASAETAGRLRILATTGSSVVSRRLMVAASLVLIASCTTGSEPGSEPGAPWISVHGRDHALTGKVWHVASRRFVEPDAVVSALKRASFVLLGEKHDNRDHHRIQAWLVGRLIEEGRRPVLAFEMLTSAQEERLQKHLTANPNDAAGIGAAVAWEKTGWPPWSSYRPMAEAALRSGAPIVAASLARRRLRALAEDGIGILGSDEVERLGLRVSLPEAAEARLRETIVEGHCNRLPASMIGPMVTIQRVKDAYMAGVLKHGLEARGRDGVVLIAGDGHVRRDYGVPWHLRRLAPGRRIAVVALLEVQDDATTPEPYGAHFGTRPPPVDYLWFTPRADNSDPCETYAEQLRRAKSRREKDKSK